MKRFALNTGGQTRNISTLLYFYIKLYKATQSTAYMYKANSYLLIVISIFTVLDYFRIDKYI